MIEYRTIDKSGWPERGAWDAEPDKKQWCDEATGLPCLAVRNKSGGNWCGYVGVSKSHPAHGLPYDAWRESDEPELPAAQAAVNDITVHGGLTFSDACQHGDDPSRGICHIPEPGEPDDVWWFGFDCAHCDDICPAYRGISLTYGEYRDLAYVEAQCADLARQLAAMEAA